MRLLCFLLFILLAVAGFSQTNPRERRLLDDGWKFHFGHAGDPSKDFNYGIANLFAKTGRADKTPIESKFNDREWKNVNLPHDWAVALPFVNVKNNDVLAHGYKPVGGLFPETSIGWYRKKFTVARADSGNRFSIQFDGVFRDAKIWLNGFYVGNNESGYVGETFDITDYLHYDRENLLVVRVDATQYEGWFYEGAGIYRHVWLNKYHNTHIRENGVFVHTKHEGGKALVTVETELVNKALTPADVSVQVYITDRNGRELARSAAFPVALGILGTEKVEQNVPVNTPRLWSIEDPYLYRAIAVVKHEGKVIDSIKQRFGIRTVTIDANKGLFLNGKQVKLKGTNNHHDHAGIGTALPDAMHYYRIRRLKEMGSNAYRTSHNAPNPELLDACDSLGMLVMDEHRLLNSSPEYTSQLERLIRRDRNHPSVFMWSIGNEEGYVQTNSFGRRIGQSLLMLQQKLDPTRTSTYAADLANFRRGINEIIPVRGFNYRDSAVAAYHRDNPGQPIVGTEMGSTVTTRGIYKVDTVNAYVPDQDITSPWWASTAEEWWTLAAVNDYWMGGFIWTGFDYRGEPTPYEWPNINSHFGVMDVCGFPKNIYYYYKSWWSDEDVVHISPHWNWKGKEGEPIEVWVNSNAEQVELFLNGKSYGKKEMPRNRHLKWMVPYKAGKLEAIGWRKGKKIKAVVETTSAPDKLVLQSEFTMLDQGANNTAVVNIHVIDAKGKIVPDVNEPVTFTLSGPGKIIGVGNGDPSSHEPDQYAEGEVWNRKLFNGKCQVIVQVEKEAGKIILEAKSAGIKAGMVSFEVK